MFFNKPTKNIFDNFDELDTSSDIAKAIKKHKTKAGVDALDIAMDYSVWFGEEAVRIYGLDTPEETQKQLDDLMATVCAHLGGEKYWWEAQVVRDAAKMAMEAVQKASKNSHEGSQIIGMMIATTLIAETLNQLRKNEE